MKSMKKIELTLSEDIMYWLLEAAEKLSVSEDKIIEGALVAYLGDLKSGEYQRSFQAAKEDEDIAIMAEEGMSDYFHQIETM